MRCSREFTREERGRGEKNGRGEVGFVQLCPLQPEARGREEIVGERLRLGGLKLREREGERAGG